MKFDRILLHCPELTLKGKNQIDFQHALLTNVRRRLSALGLQWRVSNARGRLNVDIPPTSTVVVDDVVKALAEVCGVETLAPALWFRPGQIGQRDGNLDINPVIDSAIQLARTVYRPRASYAVRVNRVDKSTAVKSQDMERQIGSAIGEHTDWGRVDLNRPDCRFQIDIYPDGMYLYAGKIKAGGGLPVHTSGRVLSLLSGGIDSPVATYLMARRGCSVDLFHMTASHAQLQNAEQNVVAQLAQQLSRYTLTSRFYLMPYTHFDMALLGKENRYGLVLFRRFMTRVAEALAQVIEASALVCGDSLGQVASQTLENLITHSHSVTMPILRPLIAFNKQEIIEHARNIGTYEISIQPYKDCCALLSDSPRTRSDPRRMADLEEKLIPAADYQALIEATLADTVCIEYNCGELIKPPRPFGRGLLHGYRQGLRQQELDGDGQIKQGERE